MPQQELSDCGVSVILNSQLIAQVGMKFDYSLSKYNSRYYRDKIFVELFDNIILPFESIHSKFNAVSNRSKEKTIAVHSNVISARSL